jgi:hypothetical protein
MGRGIQRKGGPVEIIWPGDRVSFEPGENHWHGAAPNRFMVHIALAQNDENGSPVSWGEHATDARYSATPRAQLPAECITITATFVLSMLCVRVLVAGR